MEYLQNEYLLRVFLVFVRISGLFIAAPFFGHRSIPVRIKVFSAVMLSYILVGLIPTGLPAYGTTPVGTLVAIGVEALTGLTLGFAAQFIFWMVQYFADTIGFQMGLSLAQVMNPVDGTNTNPIGRFISLTLLMVFILIEGHHQILQGLLLSFQGIPLGQANLALAGPLMLEWMGTLFLSALRLTAPFMVTFFMVESALGVFARVAPQADLFSLSLPLKIIVGISMTIIFLQHFLPTIPGLVDQMYTDILRLIEAIAP